jgi:hypothetical protein
VVGPTATIPNASGGTAGNGDVFASCAAGESLIGGGFIMHGINTAFVGDAFAVVNSPDPNNAGRWFVRIVDESTAPVLVEATAICVNVG